MSRLIETQLPHAPYPRTKVSILDEDDMVSDSAVELATQQSIKAYIDNTIVNILCHNNQVICLNNEIIEL